MNPGDDGHLICGALGLTVHRTLRGYRYAEGVENHTGRAHPSTMRSRIAAVLLAGALVSVACGSEGDVVAEGPARSSEPAQPAEPAEPAEPEPGAAAAVGALDCPSGLASGLSVSEAPPAPGEARGPAAAAAAALRAKGVLPEVAQAVEALGTGLEGRVPSRAGAPPTEVATGLGPDGSVDVTATADAAQPGTPTDLVVTRDDRPVVIVSVSEHEPGYWALDQLWACSEEVAVTEYHE